MGREGLVALMLTAESDDTARGSFQDAVAAIERCTGQTLARRQVQELAQLAAVDFEDFYEARRPKRRKTDQLWCSRPTARGS